MYKIICDSSCDILSLEGINFEAVPLTISTDEKIYVDDADLDIHGMLDDLEKYNGRSRTACPSTDSWLKAMGNADEIYVFALTSGLSGTYNSACIAKDIYMEEHPSAHVHVFDTLTTASELRLHVERCAELKKEGKSFYAVVSYMTDYMKTTRLFFAFKSLHNFAQNGRVNKVVAQAVGVLGLSILGTASQDGKVEATGKCRGDKKVIAALLNDALAAGYNGGKIRICHMENEALANKAAEAFATSFPGADILVYPAMGLCSYYGERGGIILSCECRQPTE